MEKELIAIIVLTASVILHIMFFKIMENRNNVKVGETPLDHPLENDENDLIL